MKNKKIILDIIMFVIMFLLMRLFFTGILLHEVLGLAVFGLFVLHKIMNFNWIKNITKSIINRNKINGRIKLRYYLDWLLFIDVFLIILSGIIISQVLFVNLFTYNVIWSTIHHFVAALGFLLMVLHTLLHYVEIKAMFKKKLLDNKGNKIKLIYYYLVLIVVLILPIGVVASENFINYLTGIFKGNNNVIDNNSDSENDEEKEDNSSVKTDDDKNTNSSTTNNNSNTSDTTKPTLYEYLSKLHCNGCSRHCFLVSLGCFRGNAYVDAATQGYNEIYGTAYNMQGNIELDGYTVTIV